MAIKFSICPPVSFTQGCVVGGFLGLALPLWISIGAYSLPSKSYKLAFPTHNCSVYDYNITMTTITSSYDVTTNMTMASPTTAAPTELYEKFTVNCDKLFPC